MQFGARMLARCELDRDRLTAQLDPGIGVAGSMRFFFDIHDNGEIFADEDGQDFPSIEAATAHARQLVLDIGNDEIPRNGPARSILVHIRTEDRVTTEVSLDFRTSPQVRPG